MNGDEVISASASNLIGKAVRPPTVPMNQAWPARLPIMEACIQRLLSSPVNALEIGTWFGLGSTQIWLKTLPPGSTLTLIDAWRPYSSEDDLKVSDGFNYREMDELSSKALLSTLKEITDREKTGNSIEVNVVRARAGSFLKQLRPDQFDFIYIDGSHYYADIKTDIQCAKSLAKDSFSIICGDDCEALPTENLLAFAKQNVTRDFIQHPSGTSFHPGVMLAISEEFKDVNMKNGFWWIYKRNGRFGLF
jgi:hypothetical protein